MYDEEIEKAMLYLNIFQDEQFDLTEEDFINTTHKQIIKATNELKAKKEEVSLLTINNKIRESDILEYLAMLDEYVMTENADNIYKILKRYTKKRQMFRVAKDVISEVSKIEDIDVYIEKTIKRLHNVEFQTEKETNFRKQVIETVETIEKNINKKEDRSLFTGYFDLDNLTDGLHNGEFTVIGARPRRSEKQLLHCN